MGDESERRVETKELTKSVHELTLEVRLMGQKVDTHLASHTKLGDRLWAIIQPIIIALIMSYGSYQFFEFKAREMEARREAVNGNHSDKGRPASRGGVPDPGYSDRSSGKEEGDTALAPDVDEGGRWLPPDTQVSTRGL